MSSETEFHVVKKPAHYNKHPSGVQTIEVVEGLPFCVGNAIKYVWRTDLKNGREDIEKAEWYLQRECDRLDDARLEIKIPAKCAARAILAYEKEPRGTLLAQLLATLVLPGFYSQHHVKDALRAVQTFLAHNP